MHNIKRACKDAKPSSFTTPLSLTSISILPAFHDLMSSPHLFLHGQYATGLISRQQEDQDNTDIKLKKLRSQVFKAKAFQDRTQHASARIELLGLNEAANTVWEGLERINKGQEMVDNA